MKRPPTDLAARLRAVANDVLAPDRSASVDQVAEAAQIPRSTLYYYFAGSEELVDFLLLDKVETIGTAMRAAADDSQDPLIRLEAVLSTTVRTIAAHPTLCTMLLARLSRLSQTTALNVAVEQSVVHPLQELLDAGVAAGSLDVVDPELTAHALYGAVSMASLARFARHGRIDADRLIEGLIPQLIASVRAVHVRS